MRVKFLTPTTVFVASLATLYSIALFLSSRQFVNHEITPKRFGMIAGNRNEDALKVAQQILDKKVKIPSPAILHAVKKDTRQLIENRQAEKVVPAPESRTSFETPTTGQKTTGRDKFSEIIPKTFAPPELINMA
ncbi:MAG: hypothetical protein LBS55_10290 [Prevotellaceae bacterium]|nr:hypothetical protein [Prevotellaceae bacterium]